MTRTLTKRRRTAPANRAWTTALVLGACTAFPVQPHGAPAPASPDSTTKRIYSVQDSPGYYPAADPESASVRIGRRLDAPVVSRTLQGGARSLDDLGRAVCRALHHRDRDSLRLLGVSDGEFRDIMWREFPQSRPATGLAWEDAWRVLDVRLFGGCNGAIQEHGGRYWEFVRFERADTVATYKNFRLHNGLVLVVRSDLGEIERFGWLRSVAERKGRFKIYSMRD